MINILYINTNSISKEQFCKYLSLLPLNLRNEITRFKFIKDQKLKLFGRLLIQHYHINSLKAFNWNEFKYSDNGKPYLKNGAHFNISHSGKYVIAAFGDDEIGIDIEIIDEIDTYALSQYFHQDEKEYVSSSINEKEAFFRIWTRKEAYLKARGIGIVNGLNNENCLNNSISDCETWHIKTVEFHPQYALALCSKQNITSFRITELQIDNLTL